jgi:hypothetical protein
VTVAEARDVVARRVAARAASFARTLRVCVFDQPRSPYLRLFADAGWSLADVEASVEATGLEATLAALYEAGVRVSADRFRSPAFDNPRRRASFAASSSGTGGVPARSEHDLRHLLETVPFRLLFAAAFGVERAPFGMWLSAPPAVAAMNSLLSTAVAGNPPERWWTPPAADDLAPRLRHRIALRAFRAAAAACGARFPTPEPLSYDDPSPIVAWAAGALRRAGRCEVRGFASTGMRVALAARAAGVSLEGAVFVCGGEAASPAKQAVIEGSGGRMLSLYAATEFGPIAASCSAAADVRRMHLATDRLAVIARPQALARGAAVQALHVTTLSPAAPKVAINVDSGDCGRLEVGRCSCPLGGAGLDTFLSDVRGYRRLQGVTVTLAAADLVEELLPATFGGSPLDYQLVERPGALELRVHPLLTLAAADAAGAFVAARLGAPVTVRREPPSLSAGGKQLPLAR